MLQVMFIIAGSHRSPSADLLAAEHRPEGTMSLAMLRTPMPETQGEWQGLPSILYVDVIVCVGDLHPSVLSKGVYGLRMAPLQRLGLSILA